MKFFLKNVFALNILTIFFVAKQTVAAGLKDAPDMLGKFGKNVGVDTNAGVDTVSGNIIATALSLVGFIFLILMVYAGYLWLTSRGDETQVEKAQEIIKASILGLVVVLSAYAITFFVTSRLGNVG